MLSQQSGAGEVRTLTGSYMLAFIGSGIALYDRLDAGPADRPPAGSGDGNRMIDLGLYLGFVLATAVLILIPGPNAALIVANSVGRGTRFGLIDVADEQRSGCATLPDGAGADRGPGRTGSVVRVDPAIRV